MCDYRSCWGREKHAGSHALSAIADQEYPGKPEHMRSFRVDLVPRCLLNGPSFLDVYRGFSKDNEWRRLKYDASAFVDPPRDQDL